VLYTYLTCGIASLNHKSLNDSMEYMTIVVTIFTMHREVLYCSWALFSKELDMNVSQCCMDNGTVIQMLNTCM